MIDPFIDCLIGIWNCFCCFLAQRCVAADMSSVEIDCLGPHHCRGPGAVFAAPFEPITLLPEMQLQFSCQVFPILLVDCPSTSYLPGQRSGIVKEVLTFRCAGTI